jgi:hypothetical protein
MRRARALAGAEWGPRWDAWLLAEDRRLAELAPLLEVPQLAAELAAEFGIPRTPQAVRHRAASLGVRVPIRWMSLADVEAFIRAHPWLYDWKRMDPTSRLRSLAEVIHKADPWLTLAEAAEQSALSVKQLRRIVAQDVLPHERRWHGCGPWGQIVVRAADLDARASGGR